MKQILFINCLLCSLVALAGKPGKASIHYELSLQPKSGQITVTCSFRSSRSATTRLQLPSSFGNIHEAWRHITINNTKGISRWSYLPGDSSVLLLHHATQQQLQVQYTVHNSLRDSLPDAANAYAITIKPNYYNLHGKLLFAYPQADSSSRLLITVSWKSLPAGWQQINSFGTGRAALQLPQAYLPEFLNSMWTGGDFRVYHKEIRNQPVVFAIRGKWHFTDEAMVQLVVQTIETQRAFWNDYQIPRYTITLMPLLTPFEQGYSYQGTAMTNSFTAWATTNKEVSPASLSYLLHHELMHHWIGVAMEPEQPEALLYWFSEGFTEYYTWKNMVRAGLITADQYRQSLDSVLALHYSNEGNQASNQQIRELFWSDYTYQKLPYNRGRIFAWLLDELIKARTDGRHQLSTVLVQLLATCREQQRRVTKQLFLETVLAVTNIDISELLEQHITQGQFIDPEQFNQLAAEQLEWRQVPVFTYGFTTTSGQLSADAVVVTVDSSSGAGIAGVKPGDVLKGFNIYNSPHIEASLTVQRGNRLLNLQFYPAKKIRVPQLRSS